MLGQARRLNATRKVPHWCGSTGEDPAEVLSIFDRPGERMLYAPPVTTRLAIYWARAMIPTALNIAQTR